MNAVRIIAWIVLIITIVSLISSLGLIASYESFGSNNLLIVAFSFIIITIVLEITMCFTQGMIIYLYIITILLIAPVVILFFVYSSTEQMTTNWAFIIASASLSVIALGMTIIFTLLEFRNEKIREKGRTINDVFITFTSPQPQLTMPSSSSIITTPSLSCVSKDTNLL